MEGFISLLMILLMMAFYTSLLHPWIDDFLKCFCRIFTKPLYSSFFCLFSLRLYRHFLPVSFLPLYTLSRLVAIGQHIVRFERFINYVAWPFSMPAMTSWVCNSYLVPHGVSHILFLFLFLSLRSEKKISMCWNRYKFSVLVIGIFLLTAYIVVKEVSEICVFIS